VVGISLHLSITALAYGLPVLRPTAFMDRKYAVLGAAEGVFVGDATQDRSILAFCESVKENRPAVGALASGAQAELSEHWDKIANVCRNPKRHVPSVAKAYAQANNLLARQEALGLQSLDLEARAQALATTAEVREQALHALSQQLADKLQALASAETRLADEEKKILGLQAGLDEKERVLLAVQSLLAEKEGALRGLESVLADKELAIARFEAELIEKDAAAWQLRETLAERQAALQAGLRANNELAAELDLQNQRVAQFEELKKALVVRALGRYRSFVERTLPLGTRRRRMYASALSGARFLTRRHDILAPFSRAADAWKTGGVKLVLQKTARRLQRSFHRPGPMQAQAQVAEDEALQREMSAEFEYRPLISVVIPVHDTPPEYLTAAVQSVLNQTYPYVEICICDDGSRNQNTVQTLKKLKRSEPRIRVAFSDRNGGISAATNMACALASGELLAFLDHDDVLARSALFEIVKRLNLEPNLDGVYSDQDKIDAAGNANEPFFKPDWSPIYLESVMYVGHLLVVKRKLFEKLAGMNPEYDGVQDFEFMLRVSETPASIGHVPKVLYHWRKIPGSVALGLDEKGGRIEELQAKAVTAHLARLGVPATAVAHPRHRHRVQVQPNMRVNNPLVSIILTTRNAPDDLGRCLRSLFERSTYPNFEVIVVDNQTTDKEALKILEQHPVKVIPFDETFNFSRANNLGVRNSRGEYVILLNNDTEVLTPNWIEMLLCFLERSGVGIVGPLLVYPDRRVQHAGVILGPRGTADHVMRQFPSDSDGYSGSLSSAREVSAVTGACMMLRREDYVQFGGLVEYYGTHYQDVDFCLRIKESGKSILFVPQAVLIHREGATRGAFYDHLDRALLLDTWGHLIARGDPYFNPNFSLETADYALRTGGAP
jgi:GT2 family glycosyltransferase